MLFSVIIPLYNKRHYVRRAVDSVLEQTITDIELIVVDDGSTDGSAEELLDILDARLKIIKQENQGEGPARNTGMRVSSGQLLAFLDADDAWLPCHLNELFLLYDRYPNAGLLSTTYVEINGAGGFVENKWANVILREVDYFKEAATNIGLVWSGSAAISRDVYQAVGGFINVRAGADLEYWARVALEYPVVHSSRITCIYYRGTGGVMEMIAMEKKNKKEVVNVMSLRDVSPSVAMLCEKMDKSGVSFLNNSIRQYINGRLTVGIPSLIYEGDFVLARQYMALAILPLNAMQLFYKLVVSLPEPVLWMIRKSYINIRRLWLEG